MLDKPEKAYALVEALKAAVPFEIGLTSELIARLAKQPTPISVEPFEIVTNVSYAGDAGGILCHIRPGGADPMVVVSLTHLRISRKSPFAAAVIDYQKHRVKKMRKQEAQGW